MKAEATSGSVASFQEQVIGADSLGGRVRCCCSARSKDYRRGDVSRQQVERVLAMLCLAGSGKLWEGDDFVV